MIRKGQRTTGTSRITLWAQHYNISWGSQQPISPKKINHFWKKATVSRLKYEFLLDVNRLPRLYLININVLYCMPGGEYIEFTRLYIKILLKSAFSSALPLGTWTWWPYLHNAYAQKEVTVFFLFFVLWRWMPGEVSWCVFVWQIMSPTPRPVQ